MDNKMQLNMLKLFLEDKIRECNNAMLARQNKNLKNNIKVYSEILVAIRSYKELAQK